jgi:hypothetical protein
MSFELAGPWHCRLKSATMPVKPLYGQSAFYQFSHLKDVIDAGANQLGKAPVVSVTHWIYSQLALSRGVKVVGTQQLESAADRGGDRQRA